MSWSHFWTSIEECGKNGVFIVESLSSSRMARWCKHPDLLWKSNSFKYLFSVSPYLNVLTCYTVWSLQVTHVLHPRTQLPSISSLTTELCIFEDILTVSTSGFWNQRSRLEINISLSSNGIYIDNGSMLMVQMNKCGSNHWRYVLRG